MPKLTKYPTLEEALFLHTGLIERFGGTGGVRDMGLLESALARPRSGYYSSLSEQTAALMQSLACNHAFIDGNKRMAFALTAVFLRLNGYRIACRLSSAERLLVDRIIRQKADLQEISAWIEKHMLKVNNR